MSFIETVDPARATGEVREMYQRQQAAYGYVPNYARVFCHRPELMQAWAALIRCVRQPMDPRTYELATLGAARALGNSYCCLAHGRRVLEHYYSAAELAALWRGEAVGAVTAADLAVVELAGRVALDAAALEPTDLDALRALGFADEAIFDVVAAAAARCFFSKINDALGVTADAPLGQQEPATLALLLVGRPISDPPPGCVEVAV